MSNQENNGIMKKNGHIERSQADIAADFANTFLMHRHRGVINCDDLFVIYGNDGYSTDQRSRIESSEVWGKLREFETECGSSRDGKTWAIVLKDDTRKHFDEDDLNQLVWDTWMDVCTRCSEDHKHSNPEGVLTEDSIWEPARNGV